MFNHLLKKMKEDSEKVSLPHLIQSYTSASLIGEVRIQFIKKNFKKLIDNIFCPETKAFIALMKTMPMNKFYRRNNCKANIKMKKESMQTFDPTSFSKDYVFSDEFIEMSKTYQKESTALTKSLMKSVKMIISIRNKILTSIYDFQNMTESSGYYTKLKKKDILNVMEFVHKMSQTKYTTPHFLYDLKARDPSSDIYEDNYLSE